jgi:hypothetical protein
LCLGVPEHAGEDNNVAATPQPAHGEAMTELVGWPSRFGRPATLADASPGRPNHRAAFLLAVKFDGETESRVGSLSHLSKARRSLMQRRTLVLGGIAGLMVSRVSLIADPFLKDSSRRDTKSDTAYQEENFNQSSLSRDGNSMLKRMITRCLILSSQTKDRKLFRLAHCQPFTTVDSGRWCIPHR